MEFRLTPLARRDLEEIRRFTIATWGRAQWDRYFEGLLAVFRRATVDGTCGRSRDSLRYGMRSLAYQRHLVFFAPITHAGGETVILRIIHESRDLDALVYLDEQ